MDKWETPYKNERTTKGFTVKKTGVYLIRSKETKRLLYVGMSKSCLYKAMYRHFQEWNDRRCYRIVYLNRDDYEVRIILVDFSRVDYIERRLIRVLNPQDNRERYENEDFEESFDDWSQKEEVEVPF